MDNRLAPNSSKNKKMPALKPDLSDFFEARDNIVKPNRGSKLGMP